METIALYLWTVRNPITGKTYTTRYLASEERIREKFPDAVRLDWSKEERVCVPPEKLTAGHLQGSAPTRRE